MADKTPVSQTKDNASVPRPAVRNGSGSQNFFTATTTLYRTMEPSKPKLVNVRGKSGDKNSGGSNRQRTIVLPLSGGTQAVCVVCPPENDTDDNSYATVAATIAENQADKTTRKANHTEVERRRRQRIRFFIEKLASICMPGVSAGEVTTGNVLEKTYEHVMQTHADLNSLKVEHERDTKIRQEYQMTLDIALKDLEKLRQTLSEHAIPLPPLRLRVVDVPSGTSSSATVAESNGTTASSGKKRARAAKRAKIEPVVNLVLQHENADEEGSFNLGTDSTENEAVVADETNMYEGVTVDMDDAEEPEEN